MSYSLTSLAALQTHDFDDIIDVRSPAEFAIDHLPGAINLPALSNAERAEIGTLYKQISPFRARKAGAARVARNVATHLEGPLAQKDGSWQPLVYCWRGGQRSGSFASILSQIGWRAQVLDGGYQTYRRLVHDALYVDQVPHKLILLDGNTGTAKTALLARLQLRDVQTLDLEGMAGHRGSLLGATPAGQPAQKGFEGLLANALAGLDPTRPVVVEAESSKIGDIMIPQQMWAAMIAAPRIEISAPMQARAAFLTEAYADMTSDPTALRDRLQPLRNLRGHAVVDTWEGLLNAGQFADLARRLMEDHYDPAYTRSRNTRSHKVLGVVAATSLDADGQELAVDQIIGLINL